jgi:hypothetical protein
MLPRTFDSLSGGESEICVPVRSISLANLPAVFSMRSRVFYAFPACYKACNVVYKACNVVYKACNVVYKACNVVYKACNVVNVVYKACNVVYKACYKQRVFLQALLQALLQGGCRGAACNKQNAL